MAETFKILGIAGSLREQVLQPRPDRGGARHGAGRHDHRVGRHFRAFRIYNEDVRSARLSGPGRAELGRRIAEADGVLIATPEYNYSVPGVLKNAIDWVSRLPDQPFNGKPVAIMGAAAGRLGTARAQYHLRQIFVFLDALVMNRPEVMVGGASRGLRRRRRDQGRDHGGLRARAARDLRPLDRARKRVSDATPGTEQEEVLKNELATGGQGGLRRKPASTAMRSRP